MFTGFAPLTANFTLTPNQFFDVILQEEDCVVKVVGHLIRATLGWEDPRTKARRVEVSLPMSQFIAFGMARNSVRKGLELAMERGYIIKTVEDTPRAPARYALRWDDPEAQEEALRRERLANGDAPIGMAPIMKNGMAPTAENEGQPEEGRGPEQGRGSKNDPVKVCTLRGSKNDPPLIREESKEKKERKTLNVGPEISFAFGGSQDAEPELVVQEIKAVKAPPASRRLRSAFSEQLDIQAEALAVELQDQESIRRHRQLLGICETNGLANLPAIALKAVRKRREGKGDPLDRPGAYYQRILIGLLEEHQVFVPTAGEDDANQVRELARNSLGLAMTSSRQGGNING